MSRSARPKDGFEGRKPVIRAAIVTVAVAGGAAFYDVLHSVHARLAPADMRLNEHVVVTPSIRR